MRVHVPLLGVFLFSLCAGAAVLEVPSFPEPPQQKTKWSGPTNEVPANLLSAANALFDLGFPDPRGCDYREVEVTVSSVWSATPVVVKTRGWVLPPKAGVLQRYAICWNGLIYPVSQIGPAASLNTDTASLSPPNGRRFNVGIGEFNSVTPSNSSSSRVLLLLRLGETEAAVKNWVPDEQLMSQTQMEMKQPDAEIGDKQHYDPFLELAADWAWAQFDHVLCEHMRGEVALALAGARQLSETQAKIDAEAERRGFPRAQIGARGLSPGEPAKTYVLFLDQLPRLLADLERRAQRPKGEATLDTLTNQPDRSKRIMGLIDSLDMVQVAQMGQPGMVAPEESPIVQALIAEGDEAVEPLINCMGNDKRLTQSVGFSRNFRRDRVVISVASAARAALEQILHIEIRDAAQVKAYWQENKGMKLEERWYATLKNDQAGTGQWMQAAQNIVQLDNVVGVPGAFHYSTLPLVSGVKPKFRGEVLRGKKDPTVAALLMRRAEAITAQAEHQDQFMGVDDVQNGVGFLNVLVQWDGPTNAAPTAGRLMKRAIELYTDQGSFIMSSGHDLARYVPRLTQIRIEGGDTNAFGEYAAWIKSTDRKNVDSYVIEALQPLIDNATDPRLTAVGEWLFNDSASPWKNLVWERAGFSDPVGSDLVKVPAFRRSLVHALEKQDIIGTMQWRAGTVDYQIEVYGVGSIGQPWPDAERPAEGTKVEVRGCDWIVWSLSNAKRVAFFNPFAPVAKRDAAVREAKNWLLKDQ